MSGASAAAAAPVFAALGDATRLALVSRLDDGRPRSIARLSEGFDLTRQGVSKHLKVLEDAGVVRSERVGRESQYVIDLAAIREARDYLARVGAQWDDALGRLKAFAEDGVAEDGGK